MAEFSYESPGDLDESGERNTMRKQPSWPPSREVVLHAGWRLLLWLALLGSGFFANDWLAKSDALRATAETASRNSEAIKAVAGEVKEERARGQRLQTAIELLTEITRRQDKELDRLNGGGH